LESALKIFKKHKDATFSSGLTPVLATDGTSTILIAEADSNRSKSCFYKKVFIEEWGRKGFEPP